MEIKVYESLQSMGISRCAKSEVSERLKACIHLSGAVPPTIEEFKFLVDFVYSNFKQFKLHELTAAFELYALNRLEVERNFGTFSPKFFGDVMSAYKPIAVSVRQKTEPKVIEPQIEYKVDEEQAIREEEEWWSQGNKDWRILNYNVFDYLWKRKQIKVSKEQGEQIKAKVSAYYSTRVENDKDKENLKDDTFIKIACKRYSLMLHFNKQL